MQSLRKIGGAAFLALVVGYASVPTAPLYAQDQKPAAERKPAAEQREAAPQEESRQIRVTILGMSCPFCAYGAEKKLKKLEGVEHLEVVLSTGIATLTMKQDADVSNERLEKAVKDAGFEVAKIVRNFESRYPNVGSDGEADEGADDGSGGL